MAYIIKRKNGRRALQFTDGDGKRHTNSLGSMNEKQANAFRGHVEHILSARIAGTAIDPNTNAG